MLLYEIMKVIILICLPFHIQNTTIDTNKDENFPTTVIAWFTFPNESINWTKVTFSSFSVSIVVFWIWNGKKINIITFILSNSNTNDYDCVYTERQEISFFQLRSIVNVSDCSKYWLKNSILFFTNRWGTNHVQWCPI